jgi:hypothetical protein
MELFMSSAVLLVSFPLNGGDPELVFESLYQCALVFKARILANRF